MEVKFARLFEKDLKAIPEKQIILRIEEIINQIIVVKSIQEISGVKKLKGHKDCYRIRIGSYRLGLLIENDTLWLARLMLRKDIYKYFP